jgi:hypothetical protein
MQYPATTRRASEYRRRAAKLVEEALRVRDDADRRHLLDGRDVPARRRSDEATAIGAGQSPPGP